MKSIMGRDVDGVIAAEHTFFFEPTNNGSNSKENLGKISPGGANLRLCTLEPAGTKAMQGTVPEGGGLEDVGDAGVDVRLVAVVLVHFLAEERGEVLVHDDRLEKVRDETFFFF